VKDRKPEKQSNPNKRPLPPAEPSGIRKRRELSGNNSSFNGYNPSYKPGYSAGYKSSSSTYPSNANGQNGFKSRGFKNNSNRFDHPKSKIPAGPRGSKGAKNHHNSEAKHFNKPAPPPPPPQKLLPSQIYSVKYNNASEVYSRVQQVGEGTYGKVYKARNEVTKEYVALKRLRLETEREGFPITAIREIKLLHSFDHENIVGLLELMVEHNQIYMVFEYVDHDLTGLLSHPTLELQECHRKFIFFQLMDGLNYLHKKRVLHRDIKGSNILLDNVGRVKIADFGLARTMKIVNDNELPDYTNRVITIWYRPPELLLGATDYGREIDIWGVGCLLVELYSKTAIFKGFDEISQLCKIFNVMGTPSLEDWPDISELPWFEMLKPKVNKASQFEDQYQSIMSPSSFDLASRLLTLNPKTRLTAEQALQHRYFTEEPRPEPLEFLRDLQGEWHEFETKKRRRKERKRAQEEEARSKDKKPDRTDPATERTEPPTEPRTEPRTAPPSVPPTAPRTIQASESYPDSIPPSTQPLETKDDFISPIESDTINSNSKENGTPA
jgi:CTD kinase subunit alpha